LRNAFVISTMAISVCGRSGSVTMVPCMIARG
jgi:hypothetical protein